MDEWDVERNAPLRPDSVSYGSKKKVWWRCEKGHEWEAAVYARTGGGTGCPVCAGRMPVRGKTDLATLYPALAAQWHPLLNGMLTAGQVRPESDKRVWWVCENGHRWRESIRSRVGGRGCPACRAERTRRRGTRSRAVDTPARS